MSRQTQPRREQTIDAPDSAARNWQAMSLRKPRITIAALGLVGLVLGLLAGFGVNAQPPRYQATATLAMTPASGGTTVDDAGLWEVLSRGQATQTTAALLGSSRNLPPGAADSGVSFSVAAVPDTTLLEAKVQAKSPRVAEQVLDEAIQRGMTAAQGIAGPFALKIAAPAAGSAVLVSSSGAKVLAALGVVGLVGGLVLGLLIVRFAAPMTRTKEVETDPQSKVETESALTPAAAPTATIDQLSP